MVFGAVFGTKQQPSEATHHNPNTTIMSYLVQFLQWKGSYALEVALFGYVMYLAIKVRDVENARGRRFNWLSSILRLLCLSFGGGTVVPIVLGMRPFPFANDAAITLTLVAWWICHYSPGDFFYRSFKASTAVRCVFVFLFEVMRCNVIIKWLSNAHTVIPAGQYYAIPIWGPILSGALAGCFGGFLHGGFSMVESAVPWLAQSSFYVSIYFHAAVYDPTIGPWLQAMSPFAGEWREVCHVSAVLFLAGTAVLQEALADKDFNPFRPVHRATYALLNIPSADKVKSN
mmetsp:Transcript_44017/g.88954  ORF Transcript_44017/g.88954 Transcript_44017/m.88954 type:complete len:287 (+) Transcript_44017:3-863(+)